MRMWGCFFKRKAAGEIHQWLEFRRVVFRSGVWGNSSVSLISAVAQSAAKWSSSEVRSKRDSRSSSKMESGVTAA